MNFVEIFELVGVVAFAMSGVLVGIEYGFDVFGIFILAFLTALGGGLFRDMMLGQEPPVWFTHFSYIICVAITVLLFLIFLKVFDTKLARGDIERLKALITFFDAIGLGIFCVTGTAFAINMGYGDNILLCVASGLVTSIVGGMLRDVLLNEVPLIFRKDIYAIACICGGLIYYLCMYLDLPAAPTQFIAACSVILIRILAVRYGISLPALKGETRPAPKEK